MKKFRIPNSFFKEQLTAHQKSVYMLLLSKRDKMNYCSIPLRQMHEMTGFNRRTLINSLQILEDQGIIKVIKTPGKINGYELLKITGRNYSYCLDTYDKDLTVNERLVFAYLSRCSNKEGKSYPSKIAIAINCSICEKSVYTATQGLCFKELITKVGRKIKAGVMTFQTSNLHTILNIDMHHPEIIDTAHLSNINDINSDRAVSLFTRKEKDLRSLKEKDLKEKRFGKDFSFSKDKSSKDLLLSVNVMSDTKEKEVSKSKRLKNVPSIVDSATTFTFSEEKQSENIKNKENTDNDSHNSKGFGSIKDILASIIPGDVKKITETAIYFSTFNRPEFAQFFAQKKTTVDSGPSERESSLLRTKSIISKSFKLDKLYENGFPQELIDHVLNTMANIMLSDDEYISIAGNKIPTFDVKTVMTKLKTKHIAYMLKSILANNDLLEVRNIDAYMRKCLFTSKTHYRGSLSGIEHISSSNCIDLIPNYQIR